VPHFKINEKTGRYIARHSLTDQQIIKVANMLVGKKIQKGRLCTDSDAMQLYLKKHYGDYKQEVFVCVFLTNQLELIAHEIMFKGTINRSDVYAREIVRRCLEHNAAAIIFCHNHPSGLAEPSQSDISITKQLKLSLSLIDVRVLDHIIVGDGAVSMAQLGHV
jgi:DNA repair protein RadC